jgi:hypothetical protein
MEASTSLQSSTSVLFAGPDDGNPQVIWKDQQ